MGVFTKTLKRETFCFKVVWELARLVFGLQLPLLELTLSQQDLKTIYCEINSK